MLVEDLSDFFVVPCRVVWMAPKATTVGRRLDGNLQNPATRPDSVCLKRRDKPAPVQAPEVNFFLASSTISAEVFGRLDSAFLGLETGGLIRSASDDEATPVAFSISSVEAGFGSRGPLGGVRRLKVADEAGSTRSTVSVVVWRSVTVSPSLSVPPSPVIVRRLIVLAMNIRTRGSKKLPDKRFVRTLFPNQPAVAAPTRPSQTAATTIMIRAIVRIPVLLAMWFIQPASSAKRRPARSPRLDLNQRVLALGRFGAAEPALGESGNKIGSQRGDIDRHGSEVTNGQGHF